jgi:hypothetical protein
MPADPSITIHPASMVVAEESAALLSVTASGTTPFSYQWQLDGEDIPDANDSTYLIESVTTSNSYRVLVSGPNGAELSRAATDPRWFWHRRWRRGSCVLRHHRRDGCRHSEPIGLGRLYSTTSPSTGTSACGRCFRRTASSFRTVRTSSRPRRPATSSGSSTGSTSDRRSRATQSTSTTTSRPDVVRFVHGPASIDGHNSARHHDRPQRGARILRVHRRHG